ncbi:BTAD domain-containing putative transcriptional regulator [Actinomycetes bacterium KLBMP 9797]
MEFLLLGPMELRVDGHPVDLGPPRQRSVLAALAVEAGRPVQVDTVIDRVWDQAPPARARKTLYVYISRIREAIRPLPLAYRSRGYVLDIDPDLVDLCRFRRLIGQARGAGQPDARRRASLREALGLWRGDPLADLPGTWAARVREAADQQRLAATVLWAEIESRLGDPGAVVGPLTDLLGEYPMAEQVAAALMRALRATGSDAAALACYAAVRRRLVEELGADPGAELQQLHGEILRGRPHRPAARVAPAQLPLEAPGFVGRRSALGQLDAALGGDRTAVVTIAGMAGIGKTALAVHWAHRVADRFPDGQLYVNLRGFDPCGPVLSPAEAVRGFLDALGVAPDRVPAGLPDQSALFRSLVTGRRMLVVLDNARNAEQVRPLLPGSAGCLTVVTSRDELAGLVAAEGARPIRLDLLTGGEAEQLLVLRLGAPRVAAEPAAASAIVAGCARLPLALAMVAARAATRPDFPLSALSEHLRRVRSGLDVLASGDAVTDLRAVFSWSYRALGDSAARLFRLLGLPRGPHLALAAVASLAGVPEPIARPALAELTRTHLVAEPTPGRFTFHDLLRAYAAELTATVDTRTERRAALLRLLDHYLHTAHAAALRLHPHRNPITLGPAHPDVHPEAVADQAHALAWFTAEHSALLAAIELATEHGFDRHVCQLAWTLADFLDLRGHWPDQVSTQDAALAAAGRLDDHTEQAQAHRGLGVAYARLGRFADAQAQLEQALAKFGAQSDQIGLAQTHCNLSWLLGRQQRQREGLGHDQHALALYRAAGHRAGQARALNAIGWNHAQSGDYQQALDYCGQALALHRQMGNRPGQAHTWDSLGYAHYRLRDHQEAIRCYGEALALFQDIGDRYYEATILAHLADAQAAAGAADTARTSWQAALEIFDELGHPDADQIRDKLRPKLLSNM